MPQNAFHIVAKKAGAPQQKATIWEEIVSSDENLRQVPDSYSDKHLSYIRHKLNLLAGTQYAVDVDSSLSLPFLFH
jgi:hypothetical protein